MVLGTVTMLIEPTKLVPGSKFITSPLKLICIQTVEGVSLSNWEYTIIAAFDGSCLSAELLTNSASLRNKNLSIPISQLDDTEDIVMATPPATLKLSSTLAVPFTSAPLLGRFTLRDCR
jgi:hypothetical protein